jgi:hypothetical protein
VALHPIGAIHQPDELHENGGRRSSIDCSRETDEAIRHVHLEIVRTHPHGVVQDLVPDGLERLVVSADIRAHEVGTGQDPHEASVAHNWQSVDGAIKHERGRFTQRVIGADRHGGRTHRLDGGLGRESSHIHLIGPAQEAVQDIRWPPAEAALLHEEIALGDDADQFARGIHHRRPADPALHQQASHVVERHAGGHGADLRGHDVSDRHRAHGLTPPDP